MKEYINGDLRLTVQRVPRSDWYLITLYNAGVFIYSMLAGPAEAAERIAKLKGAV